ncbi:MAG: TetR/AcrR family transcriptional regulator [Firmicutes bacterium]|nr:TetR/AcrR family transcriptional regulator [Bacillota bacterium]
MPKQTFFNLEESKRQAILDEAVREFAKQPFEQASLTKIVENCGIAKGSMYQYFEDKRDLYLYIVDLAYEEKRNYLRKAFETGGDIFEVLEEYYRQSYQFAQEHPLFHQVANKFWDSKAEALSGELEKGRLNRAKDFEQFLSQAMESGEVNADLDPEAVFFVYHAVGKELIVHFDQGCDDRFWKQVLDVLKYGIAVREGDKSC